MPFPRDAFFTAADIEAHRGFDDLHLAERQQTDEVRSLYLTQLIKRFGRCRYCGKKLSDEILGRTPGLCGAQLCRRRANREALAALRARP